jgi:lon-related putative ATP-dependent protease
MPKPLAPEQLYTPCRLPAAGFETTHDLPEFEGILGQARAVEAVDFGLAIPRQGFNLYVMGPAGVGKHSLVQKLVGEAAEQGRVPSDWVYVNNFHQPHKPRAIALPPGQGQVLRQDMQHLVEDLLAAIPAIFESDEYRNRLEAIENEFSEREAKTFRELGEEARQNDIALVRTPNGFGLAPMKGEEVLTPDEFEKLPVDDKKRIAGAMDAMREKLHKLIRKGPQWQREKRAKIRALNQEFSRLAVGHQIGDLRDKFAAIPAVLEYLQAVEEDLVENADDFRKPQEAPTQILGITLSSAPSFRRYQVNPLVDRNGLEGAPVVAPDHPGYPNLIGRIEHVEHLGALVTDFSLIKPGALHQANGGYLILDVRKLLMQPFAWEGLKRALRAREVKVESLGQMLSLVSTVSLEPEPIPLDVKVVLLGERLLYYLLYEFDPDFPELFKVVADFEDELPRDDESHLLYARLIGTLVRKEGLLPFERAACARLIEQAAREAEDAERLSSNMQSLVNLMREADFLARRAGDRRVSTGHVQAGIDARMRRTGRLSSKVQEAILRGMLHIETGGQRIGQVNGLSVIDLGDSRFSHPTRITATVRLGEGEVIDIQKEVNLAGAIHSKGVMTLSAFLATRYANVLPLSLTASLTFEQTYGEVEGDSASMAELCVLLSAIGDLPIKQNLAITGSVDQCGRMQPIGGVNEKIEGFFDLCAARGLTGEQGVVIPAENVVHLMLKAEVVAACQAGRFRIWPVGDVDEAIELLTDLPAGQPDEDGVVPDGSVNYRVAARLIQYSTLRQAFSQGDGTISHKRRTSPRKKKTGGSPKA